MRDELKRYLYGLLAGIFIAALIINWNPPKESVPIPQDTNQYSVLSLTNWYEIVVAPLTWPAPYIQHQVNFGCSSDSEATGCYGTMNEINSGRIYLAIVLALYLGLIFLYWPNAWGKSVSDGVQAMLFVLTVTGILLPFYGLFPEIIQHNSGNWMTAAFLLLLVYVPAGLLGIYQIIRARLQKRPRLAKFIGWLMLAVFYLLGICWYLLLEYANGF